MHELSLASNALEIILETGKAQAFSRVSTVQFEVGLLSCVQVEALEFALHSTLENTIASGAELVIKPIPGSLRCDHCEKVFESNELYTPCPECGKFGATIIAGKDVSLTGIEGY